MNTIKLLSLLSLILIAYMSNGQIDPNVKNQNGHLKANGSIVHPHSQTKSSSTYKNSESTTKINALSANPGSSNYSKVKKDYIKKKVAQKTTSKAPVSKKSKMYKLYAPKAHTQEQTGF